MKEFHKLIKDFKKGKVKKVKKPRIWKEKDVLDGKIVDAFVFILRTSGCRWAKQSGCTMCGYFKESYDAGREEIKKQIAQAIREYNNETIVKIFTSGSFFDEKEIPRDLQSLILKKFEKAKKIIVESRPEFVNALEELKTKTRLEIAMGLESANDKVLKYAINKGFTFQQWKKSAERVIELGKELKVYILIKPPFLTEKEAIDDAIYTVEKVKDMANTISFNPVAIHGKTVVEFLWKHGLYRPPWLWSVIEILKESREIYNGLIKCDVVAGGKERGAHNCGKCDKNLLDIIKNFSLMQEVKETYCYCKEEWRDMLEIEEFFVG